MRSCVSLSRLRSAARGWNSVSSFHSSFIVYLDIPQDKIDFSFVRSSGPGGQNVNKVNTKAQLRFHVKSADWIPTEAKERFSVQQAHRMNNDGEFIITSQEQRSQTRNKADCLKKLKSFLDQALIEPKTREQWQEIGEKGKATRKKDKIHTKNKKSNRRGGDFY